MKQEKEIWRPVVGYEGYYEVSSYGRVRTIPRLVRNRFGLSNIKGRIRKQSSNGKGNYQTIMLSKNNITKRYTVHKLVGMAFQDICGKYAKGLEISHLDENPLNNRAENLKWVTHTENVNWGSHNQKMAETQKNRIDKSKPILCVELNLIFPSIAEAGRWLGNKKIAANITLCLQKKTKSSHGYHWEYINEKEVI